MITTSQPTDVTKVKYNVEVSDKYESLVNMRGPRNMTACAAMQSYVLLCYESKYVDVTDRK